MTAELPAIRLQPFDEADFDAWRSQAVPAYATDHVASGTWTVAECLARSQEAYDALLPAGLATPGHSFSSIVAWPASDRVGFLWWATTESAGRDGAYVYGIGIDDRSRRQGYAKAALGELERIAREHGMQFVALHVFGHNAGARRLYEELGFVPTSISLRKDL